MEISDLSATGTYLIGDQSVTTSTKILHENTSKSVPSWDDMFEDITSIDTGKKQLLDTTVYSLSVVEAMEQIQSQHDNLESSLEAKINPQAEQPTVGCYACGGNLRTKNNVMSCQSCGLEIKGAVVSTAEDESTTVSPDYNVNGKGFISVRVIGKGSYGYNRNLMKTSADYTVHRRITNLKEMHNWNAQCTSSQVSKNVIEDANNLFATIKQHGLVYRKDSKKGVQGSCLYHACHMNGVSRTHTEIAQLVSIAEKFLSAGDRILRDLNERGIISIPARIDSVTNYINRYFELLGIPDKYKQFVIDMIAQADEDRLHVLYDSKSNTKCIGTIYMLVERVPELRKYIDKERIESECMISKTTFIKYHTMLCKYYRRFVHVFAKHRIPLKSEWREETKAKPKIIHRKVKPKTKSIKEFKETKKEEESDTLEDLIMAELTSPVVSKTTTGVKSAPTERATAEPSSQTAGSNTVVSSTLPTLPPAPALSPSEKIKMLRAKVKRSSTRLTSFDI